MRELLFSILGVCSVLCLDRPCHSNICLNGGTCTVDDVTRRFKCECPSGSTGTVCQDECSLKCQRGKCSKTKTGEEECKCDEGWIGTLCEASSSSLDGCTSDNSCPEGQRCLMTGRGVNICFIDPCSSRPCQNGGNCTSVKDEIQCDCPAGFQGKLCQEDINECQSNPCQHGGTCLNFYGTFECLCPEQFKGPHCDQLASFCQPNPCENNGTCVEMKDDFHCLCQQGYNGKKCDKTKRPTSANVCASYECENQGMCSPNNGKPECICLPEWKGERCQIPNECLVNTQPCENNSTCIRSLAGTRCVCPKGFSGTRCELQNPASASFAAHPMTSTTTTSTSSTIRTSAGFTSSATECLDRPCLNGGKCTTKSGVTVCECPSGFHGPFCGAVVNTLACSPNPCANGAECDSVGDPAEGGFMCTCPPGFSGHLCDEKLQQSEWQGNIVEVPGTFPTEPATRPSVPTSGSTRPPLTARLFPTTRILPNQEINSCDSCEHSSRCVETPDSAICICKRGYIGAKCDKQGEICPLGSCPSHKVCRPLITQVSTQSMCGCPIGYSGEKCSKETTSSFTENSTFIYQSPSVMIGSSSGPLPYSLSVTFRTTVPNVHIATGENIFGQRLYSISLVQGKLSVNVSSILYSKLLSATINDGSWYTIKVQKSERDFLLSVIEESGYELSAVSLSRPTAFDVFSTRVGKISENEYFVGCMAEISIDDSLIDIITSSRGFGIAQGCDRTPQCTSSPCHNGGTCVDFWKSSSCVCPAPFLPPRCMHSLPPSTFGHDNTSSQAEILIPTEISQGLRFASNMQLIVRTNKANGTILYIGENDPSGTFEALQLMEGKLYVRSRAGGRAVHELYSHRRIDDNVDHLVRIDRKLRHVQMYVDGVLEAEGSIPARFDHPIFVEKMMLGSTEESIDAFSVNDYYKGSLQDIRVNDYSVVLHSIPHFEVDTVGRVISNRNVLEGSISDDVCAALDRCQKGTCLNTFNDYDCKCDKGFYGRNCDKKDFCITSPCPKGGNCLNVDDGYMCTSAVTFVKTSRIGFTIDERSTALKSIEFSLRTHSMQGHILTLMNDNLVFTISLFRGQLILSNSPANSTDFAPFTVRKTVADGSWKKLRIQGTVLKINENSYGIPPQLEPPKTISSASLFLGATAVKSFEGCLQNVKIGETPVLSFYRAEDYDQPKNIQYWKQTERRKIATNCLSSPQCGEASRCLNGAECVDMWNKFRCDCLDGFEGEHCEVNIDECRTTDCGHGYCVDRIGEAKCICDPGYTGENCETTMNACDQTPCENGGLCASTGGTFECECMEGWTGKMCTIKQPSTCSESPCQNGGICNKDSHGVSCRCRPGTAGPFCEDTVDPCASHPCRNGICKAARGGFTCVCEKGFTGHTCAQIEDTCTKDSCSGRGKCENFWNSTLCQCDQHWRGASCSEDVDECLSIPCSNDGQCINTAGSHVCKCRKYYLGDRCEVEGSCLQKPCVNGDCIQLRHDEHTCSCKLGYEGDRCEHRINYCRSSPCKNGATCESLLGKHLCHCIPGFAGESCETDIDECAFGYCSNGARCKDRVADYECLCQNTGFTGKNCTEDIDECMIADNCIKGHCTNTHGGYKCACQKGYIGRRCSMKDPCLPDAYNRTIHSCVHGQCVNPIVKIENEREVAIHECKCTRGYTGPQCTTKVEERRALAIGYVLGPLIAVLSALCLLGCALFLFVMRGKRAMHGHYSPSNQEHNGARLQMNTMIKLPPEERLI